MKPSFENGISAGLSEFFSRVFEEQTISDLASLSFVCEAAKRHLSKHIREDLQLRGKLMDVLELEERLGIGLAESDPVVYSVDELVLMAIEYPALGDVRMPETLCQLVEFDPTQSSTSPLLEACQCPS